MGEWHKVGKKLWSPCDGCEMGHCAYSCEMRDGEPWVKIDTCQETCQRYKDWLDGKLTEGSEQTTFMNNLIIHNVIT